MTPPAPTRPALAPLPRLLVALLIGAASAVVCAHYVATNTGAHPADFEFWWRGARLWLDGVNPYAMHGRALQWPLPEPLIYPLPALLVSWPLHAVALPIAAAIFIGVSTAALAWCLMATHVWRLLLFVSPSFLMAVKLGQWSPALTAAALLPWAGFLFAAKPTLGLACFLYRPTWRAAISGAVLVALSLVLWPTWPVAWLGNLHTVSAHSAPILQPGGWLVLFALMRWRNSDARFLIAMACVPQVLFFYDQLPLGLIARSRVDAMVLAIVAWIAFAGWILFVLPLPGYVAAAAPYALIGCYLPALVIVLRHPNDGSGAAAVSKPRPHPSDFTQSKVPD